MKKNILITMIIGLAIQFFGVGVMLYGIDTNEKFTWIGFGIMIFGLIVISIGLIIVGLKSIKKE